MYSDVWGRMQHIFGLAIHTTPIGHRVSEPATTVYPSTRDGTCVPLLLDHSALKFGSPIFRGDQILCIGVIGVENKKVIVEVTAMDG